MAVLAPTMLLAVFAVVQGALWAHAANLTQAAAATAADTARGIDGTATTGRAAGVGFLDRAASGTLLDPTVTVTRTATTVTVTVTGQVASVLPGVPAPRVTATLTAPVEWLRPTTGRPS